MTKTLKSLVSVVGLCWLVGVAAWMGNPGPALAVGEQVGRVRGVVTNPATGQALEAVTITASGPALIGKPRTTFTNASGRYELRRSPARRATRSRSLTRVRWPP